MPYNPCLFIMFLIEIRGSLKSKKNESEKTVKNEEGPIANPSITSKKKFIREKNISISHFFSIRKFRKGKRA